MRITKNFKENLQRRKDQGYKRVYRLVGKYAATTYCTFHDINELLAKEIGTEIGITPYPHVGMWTGHPNTRHAKVTDIKYSNVFD